MKKSVRFIKSRTQTNAIPRCAWIHTCSLRHTGVLFSDGLPASHNTKFVLQSRNIHSKLALKYPSPSELRATEPSVHNESEASPLDVAELLDDSATNQDAWFMREEKRSPEANFGSKYIGLSGIPYELDKAISGLLNNSDKYLLRSDAKRLFLMPSDDGSAFGNAWTTEMPTKFKQSRKRKSARLTPREALAYAVVSIPAQYASIRNVLRETRSRLGDAWAKNIRGVVDFGSGTGVAMWASFAEFESESIENPVDGDQTNTVDGNIGPTVLSQSSLRHYLFLENRRALSAISKTLTKGLSFGSTKVSTEDFWGEDGKELPASPENTIAIMAFTLTDLPTDLARKQMLRELWNTKADTMIIIDHASPAGFAQVAAAREYLLAKGRRSRPPVPAQEDPTNHTQTSPEISSGPKSHVVAPCPHDGPCPMSPSQAAAAPAAPFHICSFIQRLERPEFLRKTKHASRGHEAIEYSYVVIRRGPRPRLPPDSMFQDGIPPRPQKRSSKRVGILTEIETSDEPVSRTTSQPGEIALKFQERPKTPAEVRRHLRHWVSDAPPRAIDDTRAESYYWPRILRSPLKRSGHVVFETCTKEGNIARHIIPKSQGKQHYYDARKAKWGDAFPWESKNGPDVRKRGSVNSGDPSRGKHVGAVDAGVEPSDDTPLEEIDGEWEVTFRKDGLPRMTRLG